MKNLLQIFVLAVVTLYFASIVIFNIGVIQNERNDTQFSDPERTGIALAIFEAPLVLVLSGIPGIGVGGVHISSEYIIHESKVIIFSSIVLVALAYVYYFYSTRRSTAK